ncbi:putative house-cleaning noncanonical NTP pyrophosphatase (MazG superfamily) [Saonia flava]|uniref:Putative house-cleaning noncanonical NTP pyrophosphatase (MazG superfamily) n=1 Tax=Saonia flava TaxID=523696 RepID=A0A846QTB9_9FLAO|nr:BatD family protein [Saonia flava]NJB71298.1 putative house-cleaning noncanonical NTP pyrophosphatase (MazG superfamily) [Saonia flava]
MSLAIKKYIFLIPLLLLAFILKAQDDEVTFEVKVSKPKLGLNERLRVDFIMNKDGDDFNPPDFEGFRVLMGPSQSISSSWINGKRSYSKAYSYTLAPTARGKFSIKQASITISGKVYKSLAKEIEVTAAVDKPSDQMTADDVADESLHLVAEVSKGNPYLNEAVTVVYKLYFSPYVSVSNFRALDNPKYNNFWSQDMPVTKYNAENATYKGQSYRYVVLKRVVLYPQKTGELELEPLSLDVVVDVPTNKRDFFGGRIYQSTNKTVSAGRRNIEVKPLPNEGKPVDFTGAVGDFNFFVTTSKTHLNASESLQAKVEVTGKGNLKLFQLPKPNFPSSLEVYDPEHDESVRTTFSGMQGKVNDMYTVVPSYKGKYPIPSISFSYFNPSTEKYHTLNSDEIVVNVLEGPTDATATTSGPIAANRQAVVSSGNQFGFIKLKPNLKAIGSNYFFGSRCFYLWLLLPLLLIPLFILFRKKREEYTSDIAGNKVRKANKLAKKYLSEAKKTLGKKDAFYIALEKALHNYLKAKLKIETSEFSKDKITSILTKKQVDQETIEDFIGLLKNCEMARYSPFSDVQMQEDYDKASDVISYLDKQL